MHVNATLAKPGCSSQVAQDVYRGQRLVPLDVAPQERQEPREAGLDVCQGDEDGSVLGVGFEQQAARADPKSWTPLVSSSLSCPYDPNCFVTKSMRKSRPTARCRMSSAAGRRRRTPRGAGQPSRRRGESASRSARARTPRPAEGDTREGEQAAGRVRHGRIVRRVGDTPGAALRRRLHVRSA